MERSDAPRSAGIDTLRGIALLLILFRNAPLSDKMSSWVLAPFAFWQRGGWVGFDLFFVISGFVVSGLLFREFRRDGEMSTGVFIQRRLLRTVPVFYVMLGVSVGWMAYQQKFPGWDYVASEALLYQNYGPAIFTHTWVLAIAEHCYLTLPLLLAVFQGSRQAPFRLLPGIIIVLAIAALYLRFRYEDAMAAKDPLAFRALYTASHLRFDALLFGVLIAWCYHFRRGRFDAIARHYWILLVTAVALISPAFIYGLQPDFLLLTLGQTGLYLGCGALLICFLQGEWGFRPVATLGQYSLSIFLWHLPLLYLFIPALLLPDPQTQQQFSWAAALIGPRPEPEMILAIYFFLSIFGGILLAWIVEYPLMRLRDRLTR